MFHGLFTSQQTTGFIRDKAVVAEWSRPTYDKKTSGICRANTGAERVVHFPGSDEYWRSSAGFGRRAAGQPINPCNFLAQIFKCPKNDTWENGVTPRLDPHVPARSDRLKYISCLLGH
jgi:hypothetical protein